MKRKIPLLILFATLAVSLAACCTSPPSADAQSSVVEESTTAPVSKSADVDYHVITQKYDDIQVHSYMSGNVSPVIVETSDKLVLIDIPDIDQEYYKSFVDSLGKPVDTIIVSHSDTPHWVGISDMFPDVPVYSIAANDIKAMDEGKNFAIQQIKDGKHTYADVEFEFETNHDIGAYVIKMPVQKAVYFDHLGYIDLNIILAPLDERLAIMKDLQTEGYTWFMCGHGKPDTADAFVSYVEDYFSVVKTAIANNDTADGAKAEIMEKYPDNYNEELLDKFLPGFYE